MCQSNSTLLNYFRNNRLVCRVIFAQIAKITCIQANPKGQTIGSLGIAVVGSRCGGYFRASRENNPHIRPLSREILKNQTIRAKITTWIW